MEIETVVARIAYEEDPSPPFRYSPDTIRQLEDRVGKPVPDDFRWYLAHVGWRKIDYDHRTILVRRGDYLHPLHFEAMEHEVFFLDGYEAFAKGNEGGLLPNDARLYVPFGKIAGGSPQLALRLLISLNDETRGSIWAVRTIGHFGDQAPSPPIRLADDLAAFLKEVGANETLRSVAEQNNEALFLRLKADHRPSPNAEPTTADNPETLIAKVFERPDAVVFDGARNVEYQYRVFGHRLEDEQEFAAKADWYATNLSTDSYHGTPPLLRRDVRIGAAQVFDGSYEFNQREHGYRLVAVESQVGENNRLKEDYLLHHDKAGWTMVRRYGAVIDDVRIKGVGTLAFDSTEKWKLKRKVTPAWSELPVDLHVSGEEDALTPSRIGFIKALIANAAFRPAFEAHVFKLYTETMYPEFEAMSDDEKTEWADCYPAIDAPGQIWTLLGKKRAIHIESDDAFQLQADACWDPEHGLTVDVENWRITR